MGMIQIDMPMPENCRMCPVCSEYDICLIPVDGKGFGEQNVSEFTESRPEWCPLKRQRKKSARWTVEGWCSNCKCDLPAYLIDYKIKACKTKYCPCCGARMINGTD